MSIVVAIAVVLLIVSVVFAVIHREQSATYYAILSAAVLYVVGAAVQSGVLQ